jgi:H+/Cl- antiporter ClcA
MSRWSERHRRLTHRAALAVTLPVALWFVLGVEGLVVGLCVVVADLVWPPRRLLAAAAVLVAALPLVVLASGLPDPAGIGPHFALGHPPADLLVSTALALLVVGTIRDVRGAARASGMPRQGRNGHAIHQLEGTAAPGGDRAGGRERPLDVAGRPR